MAGGKTSTISPVATIRRTMIPSVQVPPAALIPPKVAPMPTQTQTFNSTQMISKVINPIIARPSIEKPKTIKIEFNDDPNALEKIIEQRIKKENEEKHRLKIQEEERKERLREHKEHQIELELAQNPSEVKRLLSSLMTVPPSTTKVAATMYKKYTNPPPPRFTVVKNVPMLPKKIIQPSVLQTKPQNPVPSTILRQYGNTSMSSISGNTGSVSSSNSNTKNLMLFTTKTTLPYAKVETLRPVQVASTSSLSLIDAIDWKSYLMKGILVAQKK